MLTLSAGRGRVSISQLALHLSSHCLLAHTASQLTLPLSSRCISAEWCGKCRVQQGDDSSANQDCVIHRLVIYNTPNRPIHYKTRKPCNIQDITKPQSQECLIRCPVIYSTQKPCSIQDRTPQSHSRKVTAAKSAAKSRLSRDYLMHHQKMR